MTTFVVFVSNNTEIRKVDELGFLVQQCKYTHKHKHRAHLLLPCLLSTINQNNNNSSSVFTNPTKTLLHQTRQVVHSLRRTQERCCVPSFPAKWTTLYSRSIRDSVYPVRAPCSAAASKQSENEHTYWSIAIAGTWQLNFPSIWFDFRSTQTLSADSNSQHTHTRHIRTHFVYNLIVFGKQLETYKPIHGATKNRDSDEIELDFMNEYECKMNKNRERRRRRGRVNKSV